MAIDKNLLKAISRLQSFKENLPTGAISEIYVGEYNEILQSLAGITGEDLNDFFVADEQLSRRVSGVQPTVRMGNRVTQQGHVNYTTKRFCDRAWLLMRLDAALTYLKFLLPP